MQEFISRTIDLKTGTSTLKRKEIRDYFLKTWAVDEKLYSQLKSDDIFYHRGDPLRHVLIFYLGHTAVFYINKLFLAKIIDERVNPAFESIFAIGVDEMSWDDLDERHYNWPTVSEVRAYRDRVKDIILHVIDTVELRLPVLWSDPFWIIMMGIEHERIHLETSSVLMRQLPLCEVKAGEFGAVCKEFAVAPINEFLFVPGGEMKLGKPIDHHFYGWDNEYGSYTEQVEAFRTTKFLISNGEFLQFVLEGGYVKDAYWTEEGLNWRNFKQATMPLFWRVKNDHYYLRLVAEEIEMPWNWPVEVNYLEAKAYCNWMSIKKGKTFRLPTEAEWYRLVEHCTVPDVSEWGSAPGNINLEYYSSPCPVDKFKVGDFYDVVGNVWQWTETPITGYAGFNVHPMYDDFTTPTFDGKHNIIKGGSWISTGNEATLHARYAFRRHFYQHAGFRVVQSESPLNIHNDEYETDIEVANSCEDNWNDAFSNAENFSKQLAGFIVRTLKDKKIASVLDLNADTGRLAFELAKYYNNITAIDFSARFIRMPIQLQEKGFMRYIVKDEGDLVFYRELVLENMGLQHGKDSILFMQDNPNNLKPIYTGYDLIVVPNLLQELSCPILFLKQIHERLNDNAVMIIASAYDWEINDVKREHWPGGFKRDGEPLTSFEGISEILSEHFSLSMQTIDMPLVKRKSSRKTEVIMTEISVWTKK